MSKRLFGLLALTTACAASQPKTPLRGQDGAPACGNIGQVGRPLEPSPPRSAAAAIVHQTTQAAVQITPLVVTPSLLAPAAAETQRLSTGEPLLAPRSQEPACGNVMGKHGRRECN